MKRNNSTGNTPSTLRHQDTSKARREHRPTKAARRNDSEASSPYIPGAGFMTPPPTPPHSQTTHDMQSSQVETEKVQGESSPGPNQNLPRTIKMPPPMIRGQKRTTRSISSQTLIPVRTFSTPATPPPSVPPPPIPTDVHPQLPPLPPKTPRVQRSSIPTPTSVLKPATRLSRAASSPSVPSRTPMTKRVQLSTKVEVFESEKGERKKRKEEKNETRDKTATSSKVTVDDDDVMTFEQMRECLGNSNSSNSSNSSGDGSNNTYDINNGGIDMNNVNKMIVTETISEKVEEPVQARANPLPPLPTKGGSIRKASSYYYTPSTPNPSLQPQPVRSRSLTTLVPSSIVIPPLTELPQRQQELQQLQQQQQQQQILTLTSSPPTSPNRADILPAPVLPTPKKNTVLSTAKKLPKTLMRSLRRNSKPQPVITTPKNDPMTVITESATMESKSPNPASPKKQRSQPTTPTTTTALNSTIVSSSSTSSLSNLHAVPVIPSLSSSTPSSTPSSIPSSANFTPLHTPTSPVPPSPSRSSPFLAKFTSKQSPKSSAKKKIRPRSIVLSTQAIANVLFKKVTRARSASLGNDLSSAGGFSSVSGKNNAGGMGISDIKQNSSLASPSSIYAYESFPDPAAEDFVDVVDWELPDSISATADAGGVLQMIEYDGILINGVRVN